MRLARLPEWTAEKMRMSGPGTRLVPQSVEGGAVGNKRKAGRVRKRSLLFVPMGCGLQAGKDRSGLNSAPQRSAAHRSSRQLTLRYTPRDGVKRDGVVPLADI